MGLKVGGRHKSEPLMPKIVLYGVVLTTLMLLVGGLVFICAMLRGQGLL